MNYRLSIVVLLLAGTDVLIQAHGNSDRIPLSEPLLRFPHTIADWSGSDIEIDKESIDSLGAGDFLSRAYSRSPESQPVELFVGYFPTQRTGVSIHSPKNCLPGSGWAFESSQYLDLKAANNETHNVGEYVISDGENHQFVIYWYQAHGRSVANEYLAKMYLVIDAMKTNRTDGALIRVATPINSSESSAQARARAESFTAQLVPLLPRFIPD